MADEDKKKEYLTDDLDIDGDTKDFDDLDSDDDDDDPSASSGQEKMEEEVSLIEESTDKEKEKLNFFNEDNKEVVKDEIVEIQKSKIVLVKKLLENVKENNEQVIRLLSGLISDEEEGKIAISQIGDKKDVDEEPEIEGKIIEGVFDGENMIGPDGKQYTVPANYASKSKLVEGDILKLTITHAGTFVYKQIGPIERVRAVGILEKDNEGNCYVNSEGKKWCILPASATYFKGDIGDEVVLLIPKTGESKWGAVENIIKTPAS